MSTGASTIATAFVTFILERSAPLHYAMIPKEADQLRPRAIEYYDFFSSLTQQATGGWHRINFLRDARRGDIIAWRFPKILPHHDTGHVLIAAETPKADSSGMRCVFTSLQKSLILWTPEGANRESSPPEWARTLSILRLMITGAPLLFSSRQAINSSLCPLQSDDSRIFRQLRIEILFRLIQLSRPPCPRHETSQVETLYWASIGGSIRSTTFGFKDRYPPGTDIIGVSPL